MIEKLTVENYRSFQSYSMNNLKRVNLLTGLNNSGKTSLLEAVEILNAESATSAMAQISLRHGELLARDDEWTFPKRDWVDYASFYPGHEWIVGNVFSLKGRYSTGDFSTKEVKVSIPDFENADEERIDPERRLRYGQVAKVRVTKHDPGTSVQLQLAYPDDLKIAEVRGSRNNKNPLSVPLRVITPDSLSTSDMSELWDTVVQDRREHSVAQALQILNNSIEDVAFLVNDGVRRSQRTGVLLGYRGSPRRQPLGSAGEGTRRLLALSLALVSASRGTLIVDEIDTGLHYSVLADMWRLVIGTAVKNDIQVFATTHSLDCLRGLNEACERNPEYAAEISLQTIDRSLNSSIAGDSDDLKSAMNLGVEVR